MSLLSHESEKIVLTGVAIVVGLIVVGLYTGRKRIAEVVTKDLNPASDENIINKGVTYLVDKGTDGKRKDSGDFLYCLFNSDAITCNPELAAIANKYGLSYYDYDENNEPTGISSQVIMLHAQEEGL